ncbi:MAG: HAMP domain-containing histidine kinase [Clostridiales bacterium]|nr:HAMP domain-containing histidine kinase [Clostridiales bacterium]
MKRLAAPLLILLATLWIFIGLWAATHAFYVREVNQSTARMLHAVRSAYPDVTDQEFLEVLRSEDTIEDTLPARLGYDTDRPYEHSIAVMERTLLLIFGGVLLLESLAFLLLFYQRDRRNRRQINDLITYTDHISRGIYDLRIETNSESELSRLTNALYKITVVLKEAATRNEDEAKALSRSLADISHQIKTPLTSIRIMLDNIAEDPDMPAEVRSDFLDSISIQVDSISRLIISLLKMARFDSGAATHEPEPCAIGPLLNDVVQQLSILLEASEIHAEISGDLDAMVQLDRKWTLEALSNIVKNGIEHSPAGSTLHIRAEDDPFFLKIEIQDEGEGMDPDVQRHIFERFYKVPGSRPDSIGIGLAFAKAIIERDNGSVTVRSEPGRGAVFTIRYHK